MGLIVLRRQRFRQSGVCLGISFSPQSSTSSRCDICDIYVYMSSELRLRRSVPLQSAKLRDCDAVASGVREAVAHVAEVVAR